MVRSQTANDLSPEVDSMKQVIKATEQNLMAVFGDNYLFNVPLYQRPYAWTTEQVDELLDDLLTALRRDPATPYFLGSIVLIKGEDDPRSQVVDGQQRLTTLAMTFCVLRELMVEENQGNVDVFIRQKGNRFKGTEDQFRLSLRDRDRDFFDSHVQKQGAIAGLLEMSPASLTDSQKRITNNVDRIFQALEKLPIDERLDLATFIAQQCFLVVVTATDRDSAYRIFSVMNDRGLDLSPTDILKADTIGELAGEDQITFGAKWEAIEEALGRDDFRDLFAHIRMIRAKTKLRQTLQTDFREHVLTDVSGSDFIDKILLPYSAVYETVRDASYMSTQGAEEVNAYLRHLGRLDNFDWIPSGMVFFRENANSHERLVQFAKDLERLAYGLFIRRVYVNERVHSLRGSAEGLGAGRGYLPFQFAAAARCRRTEGNSGATGWRGISATCRTATRAARAARQLGRGGRCDIRASDDLD